MTFILKTPHDILKEIADKARALRLEKNLTQEGLSLRSGVSLGSLKRFERTGEISLKSLLEIALVLDDLDAFQNIFNSSEPKSLFYEPKIRQRGSIK